MSDAEEWYYDVETKQVSQGKTTGYSTRMGPYPDRDSAEHALEKAAERNKAADKEDEWN